MRVMDWHSTDEEPDKDKIHKSNNDSTDEKER